MRWKGVFIFPWLMEAWAKPLWMCSQYLSVILFVLYLCSEARALKDLKVVFAYYFWLVKQHTTLNPSAFF